MNELSFYTDLLGLPQVVLTGVTVTKTTIEIACTLTDTRTLCPSCGVECTVVNDRTTRRVRDLNISERAVYLLVRVRQFRCPHCGSCPSERLPFADANKSYTHRQARYVFAWCRKQAYCEVGAIVGMHAKTVERLVLDQCRQAEQLPQRYVGLRRLGIDEQSHRKGKKHFICLLTNLDTGTLVDILPDRKKETLVAYFQRLGPAFCQQITAVSCDIWQPYLAVAATCFPQATLVLDRFHVVKLLNQGLDAFRRRLRQEAPDEAGYKQLKWVQFKLSLGLSCGIEGFNLLSHQLPSVTHGADAQGQDALGAVFAPALARPLHAALHHRAVGGLNGTRANQQAAFAVGFVIHPVAVGFEVSTDRFAQGRGDGELL